MDATQTYHRGRSYWFDRASPYAPSEPLKGDQRADVCIIGGGINGVSTAYHLKQADPGCDVALIESEVVGFGASGRNAGQLIVTFGGGDFRANLRRFGAERMGAGWDYVDKGVQRIEQFIADEAIECDYTQTGFIEVSLRQDSPTLFDAYSRYVDQIGQRKSLTQLSADQMATAFDSPYLGAGIYDSRGGQLDPLKLVRGIKQGAERLGARVYENSPVAHIETSGAQIEVITGAGRIRCSKLVLATNAYTHLLDGLRTIDAERLQSPMMVYASVTEPLTPAQWEAVGWARRCGVNVLSELFYSFGPTIDGRLVYVSGYYLGFPRGRELGPEINTRFLTEGHGHLEQFFPALRGIKTVQTWGGPISITYDSVPHIGVSRDPRILYACGCWGHGMPIGARNGQTLAELALDRTTENTDMWFVRNPKKHWPNRVLVNFASNRIVSLRRSSNRRKGARMSPPLRFGQ